ncbi:EDIL3 [Branchiostoma lanceolatum]|uniref:EDIL3 protein n=1 Tax=Branchiostoma lanceolatum TaxID=7740 RepID=A0A8J9ZYM5_BRALA|nr:EDIL3 [Branchiostoma lanceolatum]
MLSCGKYVLIMALMLNLAMSGSTGQNCGGTLNKDSPTRSITSPNYPNPIQAETTCDWIIQAPVDADDVDHCASSPCTNVGTCVNGPDGFQCLCPPEYVGTRCQVSKSSCMLPLGMANGDIEDDQISASTEKTGYEAYKGRLNGPRAWQPNVVNTNQWLQVNFNTRTIITGIQTQGLWGGHVKSYRLLYGDTEDDLSAYQETGANSSKVFNANSDGPTLVSHDLDLPILASIVRVNPQDFTNNLIRLRMELLGCEDVDHCASSPCTNGGTCLHAPDGFQCLCTSEYVGTRCQVSKSSCTLPLGMANGHIEDNQISASTEKAGYEAYKGRLNGPRAWQAVMADSNQWLQVNFNTRTIITGIQTQGLWGGHVKSYRLLYGETEDDLSAYQETGANSSMVFNANSDGLTVVSHDLDLPILASKLRVNPQDFTNNLIRIRMELLGCEDVDHCASSPCTNGGTCVLVPDSFQCLCPPEYVGTRCQVTKSSCMLPLGMANGDIDDNQISASSEVAGYEAYKGRLNGPRAWEANVSDSNQWLQVNFNNRIIITGIQTQGLWGGHVKSYRLLYGDTEDDLFIYKESGGTNSSKLFDANSDGTAVVTNNLDLPVIASILRVNPQDFKGNLIRLRMELLGCEDVVPSASTQPGTTTPSTTTALPTSLATTTVSQTTSDLSTPDRSTIQPSVITTSATTSATTQTTLLSSTQSRTTELSASTLSESTTGLATATMLVSTTTSTTTVPPVETTTALVETTVTTTGPPPTTATITATLTAPMVETTETITAAMTVTSTTSTLETAATTKVTTLPPVVTTSTTPMVETSSPTITAPTSVRKTTTGVSTSKNTNTPPLVKTTKPRYSMKTTESTRTPKYTTAAKDGDKEAQTGDSGSGGGRNTAVFAAAGAAGGVVVLVGVGVTVFMCRRRNLRNSEARSVPMQRLDASTHNTDNPSADVEVENPLYGTMDEFNAVGLSVTDSSA